MMTTERTSIGRRAAVRRTAHRPPWGGRKLRHGFIVAPLAATIAATLAVGVGVALARAERDRRSIRAQRSRERQFALLPGEPLADGMTRMARGQLDLAIELLSGEREELSAEQAVHETRKALKRLRALIRLLEDELGEQAFARESAVLRDAGRRLARARDTEVMVGTLDDLLERHPGKLAHRRGVLKLRARLVAERDKAARLTLGDRATRAQVLGELRALRARVALWSLSDRDGIQAVEPALKRLYGQGRRRRRRAARARGDRARAMHEWRKRVKDLRYAAEMLDRTDPERRSGSGDGDPRVDSTRGKRSGHGRKRDRPTREPAARVRKPAQTRPDPAYIHRLARRADELGELLGEEHDLVLLAMRVRGDGEGATVARRGGRRTRAILLRLIAGRRKRLRRQALREGKRLYRRRPKKFLRRVRTAYASASRTSI
jgi:CHAD domain-containing protein